MTSKQYRYTLLTTLAMMSAQTGFAEEIARRGALAFTSDDFMAHHFMTAPAKVEALRGNPREIQSTMTEVLAARSYNQRPDLYTKLDDAERRYYDMQKERAALLAELNVRERRAKASFNPEDPAILARAREIWLTDTTRFFNEESADITQILFDLVGHSFAEVSDRVKAANTAIAAGEAFDDVLKRYSDDKNAKDTGGKLKGISVLGTDALMGNLIFKRMKEGEISAPTPSRIGLHIVRLDKKYPRSKKSFDEAKPKIIEQLLDDAAKNARLELLDKLNAIDTVVNEKAFDNFLIKTDPALEQRRREIYKSMGITVSEPLPKKPD